MTTGDRGRRCAVTQRPVPATGPGRATGSPLQWCRLVCGAEMRLVEGLGTHPSREEPLVPLAGEL